MLFFYFFFIFFYLILKNPFKARQVAQRKTISFSLENLEVSISIIFIYFILIYFLKGAR